MLSFLFFVEEKLEKLIFIHGPGVSSFYCIY